MIFLTDLIGGFWLSLIGGPSLLWARLGGALVFALNASIIFSILTNYFERKRTFIAVMISTIFLTCGYGYYILDYYYLPAFLINIELWIFNKAFLDQENGNLYNFMLGFMIVPIVLSRIPLILILFIPAIFLLYCIMKCINLKRYWVKFLMSSLGLFFSIIFFGLIYSFTGVLDGYIHYIYIQIFASISGDPSYMDQSYMASSLIKSYISDYIDVSMGTAFLSIIFYLLYMSKKTFGAAVSWILISCLLADIILLIVIFNINFSYILAHYLLEVIIGIIVLISLAYYLEFREDLSSASINILLFIGLIIMAITPIGSNTGIINSYNGMWLILPLTILCGFRLKESASREIIISFFSIMEYVLLSLLILSLFFHITIIYRDDPNRFNLSTEFSSPGLRGIYSTTERVKVVDELIIKIEESSDKGDRLLIVNSLPLIYYLTETQPALGSPWPDLYPLDMIKYSMARLKEKGEYPKLFIYAKFDTNNCNWPKEIKPIWYPEKLEYLKYELINRSNYSLVWENDLFAIYQQPDRSNESNQFRITELNQSDAV